MKRIIFINRYYKPDHSATAQLLTDLAEYLSLNQHKVIIVTSRLSYESSEIVFVNNETMAGVSVKRIWTTSFGRKNLAGRSIDYLSFYISCFFTLLKITNRQDILVAKTDPPMISVIASAAAKIKGARLINWIQDLFPEIAEALSSKKISGIIVEPIRYLRNISLNTACRNIVIGNIMLEKLLLQGVAKDSLRIIPNWVVGENITPVVPQNNTLLSEWNLSGKFIVGYSGNLGRAHDYTTILATIEKMQAHDHIIFLFIGSGAGMELLKISAKEKALKNVIFKPYQPISQLSQSLSAPDVHLITLQTELEGLIVPSKFYGVLSVNKPIIYIGSSQGELGKLITENNCGAVFESGKIVEICQWILETSKNELLISQLTINTRRLQSEKFNKQKSLNMWMDALTF